MVFLAAEPLSASEIWSASVSAHDWGYTLPSSLCDVRNCRISRVLQRLERYAVGLKKCGCNLLSDGEIDPLWDEAAVFERDHIAEFARDDTNKPSGTIHQSA